MQLSEHAGKPGRKAKLKVIMILAASLFLSGLHLGCGTAGNGGLRSRDAAEGSEIYVAQLHPLNESVAGRAATGEARFVITDTAMSISVDARGTSPGMMHLQHYHGFTDGRDAVCPTAAADTNNDTIIDLIETQQVSGVTLVPFNADPEELEITATTYPVASSDGSYSYHAIVPLDELRSALKSEYGIDGLNLDRRVVYIHGVPPATNLPASVQSLPGVPAHVTLPIACGTIERIE